MGNTLVILTFKDFEGNLVTVKNPCELELNSAESLFPESILKVYDFQTGEIITFYNEEFTWKMLEHKINTKLKAFSNLQAAS